MIDSRLTFNAALVKTLSLSNVYLKNNAQFLWFVLVPRLENCSELFHLTPQQRALLIEEINATSQLVSHYSHADKINTSTIGNIVSQLHIHVVARFKKDSVWPFSVWQALPETLYSEIHFAGLVKKWELHFKSLT